MSIITRTECSEDLRGEFLVKAAGRQFFQYEQATYRVMDKACPTYTGGYWNFYNLSNGGFYMALHGDEPLNIEWDENGFSGQMSPDAAGIGVSLITQCMMAWETHSEQLGESYHQLRDYALNHKEASLIFGLID